MFPKMEDLSPYFHGRTTVMWRPNVRSPDHSRSLWQAAGAVLAVPAILILGPGHDRSPAVEPGGRGSTARGGAVVGQVACKLLRRLCRRSPRSPPNSRLHGHGWLRAGHAGRGHACGRSSRQHALRHAAILGQPPSSPATPRPPPHSRLHRHQDPARRNLTRPTPKHPNSGQAPTNRRLRYADIIPACTRPGRRMRRALIRWSPGSSLRLQPTASSCSP